MKTKVQPWYGGRRPERSQRPLRTVKNIPFQKCFQRGVPIIILNEHLVQLAVPHIHAAKIAVAIVLPIPIHLRAAEAHPRACGQIILHQPFVHLLAPHLLCLADSHAGINAVIQRIFIMPHEEAAAGHAQYTVSACLKYRIFPGGQVYPHAAGDIFAMVVIASVQRSAVRVGERIAVHLPALGEFHHPFAPGAGSVHHVDISRGRR